MGLYPDHEESTIRSMDTSFFLPGLAKDQAYMLNRDHQSRLNVRAAIERMWREYQPYCPDSNFQIWAKDDFHAAMWQMQLTTIFLRLGFRLLPTSSEGPDICIAQRRKRLWVEAVTPKEGEGADAVSVPFGEPVYITNTPWILRVLTSVAAKIEQHENWLSKNIVSDVDGYVVAINAGRIAVADLSPGGVTFCERAVYGITDGYNINVDTEVVRPVLLPSPSVEKVSKASISTELFRGPHVPQVSALMWCPNHIAINYTTNGSDITTVHNQFARRPLASRVLFFTRQVWFKHDTRIVVGRKRWRAILWTFLAPIVNTLR